MTKVMKIRKIIAVLAIAAAFGTSLLSHPAAAQRKPTGNQYSQTGGNQQMVFQQFTLANKNSRGRFINDALESNKSEGLFKGALSRIIRGLGEVCINTPGGGQSAVCHTGTANGRYIFDSSGFPIFVKPFIPNPGAVINHGNLHAELITSATEPPYIIYSISRPGPREPIGLFRFKLSNLASFNPDLAVNDLDYIIANNLLGLAKPEYGDLLIHNRLKLKEPTAKAVP